MNEERKIPKQVFIVPYRNRTQHKFFFSKYMSFILENNDDYEIYFSHQCDARTFNRGATRNIGFLAVKNKYPEHYKDIDARRWILNRPMTHEERERVMAELQEFQNRGMMPLLNFLLYMVDTMRENNIVWGVGRGSSVASYVLYLIGVHRINSMKYNLDYKEFFR